MRKRISTIMLSVMTVSMCTVLLASCGKTTVASLSEQKAAASEVVELPALQLVESFAPETDSAIEVQLRRKTLNCLLFNWQKASLPRSTRVLMYRQIRQQRVLHPKSAQMLNLHQSRSQKNLCHMYGKDLLEMSITVLFLTLTIMQGTH